MPLLASQGSHIIFFFFSLSVCPLSVSPQLALVDRKTLYFQPGRIDDDGPDAVPYFFFFKDKKAKKQKTKSKYFREELTEKKKKTVLKEDRRGEPVVMRTGTVSRGSNESKRIER